MKLWRRWWKGCATTSLVSVVPTNPPTGFKRPVGPVEVLWGPDLAPPPLMDRLATPQTAAAATNSPPKEPTNAGRAFRQCILRQVPKSNTLSERSTDIHHGVHVSHLRLLMPLIGRFLGQLCSLCSFLGAHVDVFVFFPVSVCPSCILCEMCRHSHDPSHNLVRTKTPLSIPEHGMSGELR